jgi:hypothetical protein
MDSAFALASPWPFVRTLLRPRLLLELLPPLFLLGMLLILTTDADHPTLWWGVAPAAGPEERTHFVALCLQVVSVVAAMTAVGWHGHLVRTLPSDGAWAYPALGARIRASILLLGALLGAGSIAVFGRHLPWPEALALAALAAAWAPWPMLVQLPISATMRALLFVVLMSVAVWPTPWRLLATLPWWWLSLGILGVSLGGAAIGLAPTTLRRVLHARRPNAASPAWLVGDDAPVDRVGATATASLNGQVRAVARVTSPRVALPTWVPRALGPVASAGVWVLIGLFWHAASGQPAVMLSAFVGGVFTAHLGFWWPLGRAERLRVARVLLWRHMLIRVAALFGTMLVLDVIDAPRLPFIDQTHVRFSSLQWPLVIAAVPFVVTTAVQRASHAVLWGPLVRMFFAMLAVTVLATWGRRVEQSEWVVGASAVLLCLTLLEQEWRLRRQYLRADLT